MKIEKKKVVKNSKLSRFTKSAVAAALGIAASFGTTACDDSMSATGDDYKKQEPEPTCGETACGEQFSSSSYTDISSSGEHLSSEAIEALSSSSVQTPSSSSVAPIQSSSSEKSVSSSSESSSSTFVEKPLSSSSVKEESSSSTEVVPPWVGPGRNCNYIDSMGVNVIMCHDDDDFPLVSMVSTYEMFDNV